VQIVAHALVAMAPDAKGDNELSRAVYGIRAARQIATA
jgi:hypothetical protein